MDAPIASYPTTDAPSLNQPFESNGWRYRIQRLAAKPPCPNCGDSDPSQLPTMDATLTWKCYSCWTEFTAQRVTP